MANPSTVEEELAELSDEEEKRLERLEHLKNVARLAQLGAYAAGHPELGELGELVGGGAESAAGETGALRRAGSNIAGKQAGRLGQKKMGLSGGKGAALGGAVSAALQGEGPTGIAKGAISWYLLYIAFGALVTLVGFFPGLVYLDFHYLMSKLGSKIFGEMILWQKIVLAFANVLALILIVLAIGLIVAIPTAICNSGGIKGTVIKAGAKVLSWGGVLPIDLCKQLTFNSTTPQDATPQTNSSIVPPSDLVPITGVPIDPGTSDPRVRRCMLSYIQDLYKRSQQAKLDWVITGAYRPNAIVAGTDNLSAHARGEAVDIALRNPKDPLYSPDPRIDKLIGVAAVEGFRPAQGDTLDEYRYPTKGAIAGHAHIEFNINQATNGSYCDVAI